MVPCTPTAISAVHHTAATLRAWGARAAAHPAWHAPVLAAVACAGLAGAPLPAGLVRHESTQPGLGLAPIPELGMRAPADLGGAGPRAAGHLPDGTSAGRGQGWAGEPRMPDLSLFTAGGSPALAFADGGAGDVAVRPPAQPVAEPSAFLTLLPALATLAWVRSRRA